MIQINCPDVSTLKVFRQGLIWRWYTSWRLEMGRGIWCSGRFRSQKPLLDRNHQNCWHQGACALTCIFVMEQWHMALPIRQYSRNLSTFLWSVGSKGLLECMLSFWSQERRKNHYPWNRRCSLYVSTKMCIWAELSWTYNKQHYTQLVRF